MEKKTISIILPISFIVVFVITALACAAQKTYVGTVDGSKANGTVTVVYETGTGFVTESNDEIQQQMLQEARKNCKAWGYSNAFPLGKIYEVSPEGGFGHRFVLKCQCTD